MINRITESQHTYTDEITGYGNESGCDRTCQCRTHNGADGAAPDARTQGNNTKFSHLCRRLTFVYFFAKIRLLKLAVFGN